MVYLINSINKIANKLGLENCFLDELSNSKFINLSSKIQPDVFPDCILMVGDNLHNLTNLVSSGVNFVDLCYIDPPYNTGSKFLYHDNRKSDLSNVFGSHSAWMEFMLPRLVVAREILKSSGVIAISIDDYEFAYLKILMDSIFGESNFIGNIVVCRSKNGKGSNKNIASSHEYLMIYGKTSSAKLNGQLDDVSIYNKSDEHGEYKVDGLFRKKGEASLRIERPNMFYPLYFNPLTGEVFVEPGVGLHEVFPIDSKGVERRWLWSKETARERSWQLYASKKGVVYVKNYSSLDKRKKVRTFWDDTSFYTERATNEITKIFGEKIFDTPKPLRYIMTILDVIAKPDAIIMDFFAGSGTTSHAAVVLNSNDKGTRKTILMESNAQIPANHLARKHGHNVISDITKARFEKIKEEYPDFQYAVY
ncbi:site-specific DNA-methyltransferase [Salmonella enterica subsp. enterica serovar Glostrup]|uniref:site-specific DNA-methyltransferase (adenine-specific) n=1 Tax=Salmonella enterica TaxID=28901 RepID=A0A5U4SDT3_SALER|nr:site-specific DNA-methyltransferase [Salmonella enterica subsp. enterica serovar Aba]EAA5582116.1 site-specific DNA-methyltransferase [Salmonella enterica subsp. enterica serovar Glostrup]EAB5770310.1 site-specific DNA-methyltransferase [Salmonella enterica subsp. enterica serovar Warnow]EAP9251422.1 site-specific DNA-methyltransferase [Salmonella enterica]EBX7380515.1 site-specific DNA-methyltransferase [Salmonella enterica subsp. enterica serovar Takoradi]EDS6600584.1 site-specific DNA-me